MQASRRACNSSIHLYSELVRNLWYILRYIARSLKLNMTIRFADVKWWPNSANFGTFHGNLSRRGMMLPLSLPKEFRYRSEIGGLMHSTLLQIAVSNGHVGSIITFSDVVRYGFCQSMNVLLTAFRTLDKHWIETMMIMFFRLANTDKSWYHKPGWYYLSGLSLWCFPHQRQCAYFSCSLF